MDALDVWVAVAQWVGVLIAIGFGITSWFQSRSANRNAATALALARDANGIAEDANTISRGVSERMSEQWLTEWDASWREADNSIVLTNVGRDRAINPTVTINGSALRDTFSEPIVVHRDERIALTYEDFDKLRRDSSVPSDSARARRLSYVTLNSAARDEQ